MCLDCLDSFTPKVRLRLLSILQSREVLVLSAERELGEWTIAATLALTGTAILLITLSGDAAIVAVVTTLLNTAAAALLKVLISFRVPSRFCGSDEAIYALLA